MSKIYRLLLLPVLALVLTFVFSLVGVYAVVPSGGTLTSVNNSTAPADVAQAHAAIAGNVTEMDIVGIVKTQSWQGYYGNVTGTIQLTDNDDNVMYNWSLASPEGEIYASENSSINWIGTACFNYSAPVYNLSYFENRFNIASDDVDGINETFYLKNHDAFYVNNILIDADTCNSTRIYGDTGAGVDTEFEEVLLIGGSNELIFASLLEEDVLGFDERSHDFQMLVLEDGHEIDTATRPYYFYVELE